MVLQYSHVVIAVVLVSIVNATHAHSSFRTRYTRGPQADIVILPCPIDRYGSSAAVLLELPVTVVKRADLARLEPARDAVEVEGVL